MQLLSSSVNIKNPSWCHHMVKAGNPPSAHMLPFKHLKGQSGIFLPEQLLTVLCVLLIWDGGVGRRRRSGAVCQQEDRPSGGKRRERLNIPTSFPPAHRDAPLFPLISSHLLLSASCPARAFACGPHLANLHSSLRTCGLPKHMAALCLTRPMLSLLTANI